MTDFVYKLGLKLKGEKMRLDTKQKRDIQRNQKLLNNLMREKAIELCRNDALTGQREDLIVFIANVMGRRSIHYRPWIKYDIQLLRMLKKIVRHNQDANRLFQEELKFSCDFWEDCKLDWLNHPLP